MTFEVDGKTYDGGIMACRADRPQDYPPRLRKQWNDLVATGLPVPPTYPGSVHEPCMACGISVQVGPRQQAKRKEIEAGGDSVMVTCLICAAAVVAHEQATGQMTINPEPHNLGNPFQETP